MSARTTPFPSLGMVAAWVAVLAAGACAPGPAAEEDVLAYVGRDGCGGCHAEQVAAYAGSDHDLAMDHATAETVLGDFSDVSLTQGSSEARLYTRQGRFFVLTEGPDGASTEFEILYTFGARPLQQYLVQLGEGRIQRLPWSWDSRPAAEGGQRWFHIYDDQVTGPDDVLHWTRPSQNWNRMCADCHSTDLQKRFDPGGDRYETTWAEIDVSCEACHGPASAHLAWVRSGEPRGDRPEHSGFPVGFTAPGEVPWIRDGADPIARRAAPRSDDAELEVCARCHAHRTPIAEHRAGQRFADGYRLSLPKAPLYHADGQVKEEVFVYGSFLQSKMYRAGVGCTDCHDPHTTELRIQGNALCSQCHSAPVFDAPSHHRHEVGGAGSQCVDCHMPNTTFMTVDERRDHGFRIPRPVDDEAPNACTGCHEGRGGTWVAATLDRWYGPPADSSAVRRARTFRMADRGDPAAHRPLMAMATDTSVPAIVRATAASYLDRFPSQATVGALESTLRDVDPRVRAEGATALRMVDPAQRRPLLVPLLGDSARVVRIAAARALAPSPRGGLTDAETRRLDAGLAEFERSQVLNADEPGAVVEFGDYLAEVGRLDEAGASYRRALRIEPGFGPAYLNLADFYRRTGQDTLGEDVLREGRARSPEDATLSYALGLLYVRTGRMEDALAALSAAAVIDPSDARFAVAYALALQGADRVEEAVAYLGTAVDGVGDPTSVLLTLVDLHRSAGQFRQAARRAGELVALHPDDARYQRLASQLQESAGR